MKRAIIILTSIVLLYSCKNEQQNNDKSQSTEGSDKVATQNDGLTLLKGEFIYYADAAVLKTESEVYGVVINKKMHELNKQVQPYKSQVTDMVPVEIKGKIIPKPDNEEGWPYRIEIKEIVHISKPKFEDNNEKY
tara:strand:+ start:28544 stop:28948 length:405 start_codon:yes stop_codon:yes gene_type:complete